jgi:hypothetical protein
MLFSQSSGQGTGVPVATFDATLASDEFAL